MEQAETRTFLSQSTTITNRDYAINELADVDMTETPSRDR